MREPERMQHMEATNSLQIVGAENMTPILEIKTGDYRDVEVSPGDVIYCDIPYFNAREYREQQFDHQAFYDWCGKQTALVVISEYWMPEDRFVCVAEKPRRSTFSATNNSLERMEKLFVPVHQYEMYKNMMNL